LKTEKQKKSIEKLYDFGEEIKKTNFEFLEEVFNKVNHKKIIKKLVRYYSKQVNRNQMPLEEFGFEIKEQIGFEISRLLYKIGENVKYPKIDDFIKNDDVI
jgi:hypothetical protein